MEEYRVVPNREWFRLTCEQADLFIRLAEDQRWVRESANQASKEREIDALDWLPDWIYLARQTSRLLYCRPQYSLRKNTLTLWFDAEDNFDPKVSSWDSRDLATLRGALKNVWGQIPTIEIRVKDKPKEVGIAGESGEGEEDEWF